MQHLTTPLVHLGRFRRLSAGLLAIALAATATLAPAQTIPRQPLADSTHTYRNWGRPQNADPVCNAGFVLSGGQCVQLSSGTGATLLPYAMPPGNYTNNASYPLLLVVTPPGKSCWGLSVYVNGQLMASARDDCEYTNTSVSVMVPPFTSFSFGDGTARVTALANGVNWKDTGIFFWVVSGTHYVPSYSNGCWEYGTTYTTYTSSYGDVSTSSSYGSSYTCPIDVGGGA